MISCVWSFRGSNASLALARSRLESGTDPLPGTLHWWQRWDICHQHPARNVTQRFLGSSPAFCILTTQRTGDVDVWGNVNFSRAVWAIEPDPANAHLQIRRSMFQWSVIKFQANKYLGVLTVYHSLSLFGGLFSLLGTLAYRMEESEWYILYVVHGWLVGRVY